MLHFPYLRQPSYRLPDEKKEINLYEEDDLDETGHKNENPWIKLLHADTDLQVEKNMEILSELCDEEDEATL